MKNSEYWAQRFTQLEDAQNKIGASSLPEIEKQYKKAQKQIESEIATWYQRFADNNEITLAEARQWLPAADLKEFKWSVQDYIKAGEENAVSGQWMKQLENASAKFHISKLEALKTHTQQSLEIMFSKQLGTISSTMQDVIESGYLHTAYELQSGFGVGWDITGISQSEIESLISKPWAADGYNFSERIWSSKEKLISTIHNELTQNIMLGKDPQKAIDTIAKQMNTSKNNAGRLVMTEEAYFSSAAQKSCFNELGVEEYEIVATLDSHTSDICRSMDGQHFPMKDYQAGVTAPPFHVWCRSTTAPYFDDNFGDIGERAAREEGGKTYYIPDDMKYKDWKETFVDGGDKSGFTVIDDGTSLHYKKNVAPEETTPAPKKEYLTENKLKSKIADADVQIESLETEFKNVSGGWEYEEVIKDFGSLEDFTDGDDLIKLQELHSQMEALETQKAEWQEKLDQKLIAKEKKALTKQQMGLEAQKATLQQQLDDFEIKTYSGIWKDDVTTADFSHLNIEGKKKYYEGKFLTETDPDLLQKYQDLYKQLDELETEGKAYSDIKGELDKVEKEIKKVQNQIDNLGKPISDVKSQFSPDAYDQRKDDAWTSRFRDKYKADAYYRPLLDADWDNLTDEEKFGVWQYTHNSHPINRPLSGYDKKWGNRQYFVGLDTLKWNNENGNYDAILGTATFKKKFGNLTNPVYGGEIRDYTDVIAELTTGIEKSSMQKDSYLVRGSDFAGLCGLLDGGVITYQDAERLLNSGDVDTLKSLIAGEKFQSHSFTSTGIADGTGFGGEIAYKIYAPKGTKAIYAEPQSYFGMTTGAHERIYKKGTAYSSVGNEAEIIIQRGTTFRITDIKKTGYGKYEVRMEVVDQPDYFKTGYEHTYDGGLTSEK